MINWPQNTDRVVLETVDSTMSEARRRADQISGPTWILALEQTAGTGRRGRPWDSGSGNFSASLVLPVDATPDQLALRSFVAALSLHEALVTVTGRSDLFPLKWPNDVLLRGGKLAGILLESLSSPKGLVIGIGVNLNSLPAAENLEERSVPPKALKAETGIIVSPETFLEALAPAFDRWEDQMATFGFPQIRTAWLDRAANIGQEVRAQIGTEVLLGTFETVDDTGALVIKTREGRRAISAGDVHFNERTADAAGH